MKRKAIYTFWAGDDKEVPSGFGTPNGVSIKILAETEKEARELAKKFAKRDFYSLQNVEN
jgi:hypothetical protein